MTASTPSGTLPAVDPTAASSIEDPVPPEVHAVIALFANQLTNVSFPDVDAAVLRRQAEELRTEAKLAARAKESLDAALESFVTRLAALTDTAKRAVAYARIYSQAHPDQRALASAIAALSEPGLGQAGCTAAQRSPRKRPSRRSAELLEPGPPVRPPKDHA